ncbi:MAG: fibronectin type III domain-containing protein, partial [Oscillospiraceae bacterium]
MKQIKKKLLSLTLSAAIAVGPALELVAARAFADGASDKSALQTELFDEKATLSGTEMHDIPAEVLLEMQHDEEMRKAYYEAMEKELRERAELSAKAPDTNTAISRWDAEPAFNEFKGSIGFTGIKESDVNSYYLYYRDKNAEPEYESNYTSLIYLSNQYGSDRYYSNSFLLALACNSLSNPDLDLSNIVFCAGAKDSSWTPIAFSNDFDIGYDGCNEVSTIAPPANFTAAGNYLFFDGSLGAIGYIYLIDDDYNYSRTTSHSINIGEGTHTIKIAAVDANGDRSKFVTVTKDFAVDSWVSGINLTNGVFSYTNNYEPKEYAGNIDTGITVNGYRIGSTCTKERANLSLAADKISADLNEYIFFNYDSKIYASSVARSITSIYGNTTSSYLAKSSDYVEFPFNGGNTVTSIASPKNITFSRESVSYGYLNWDKVDGAIGYIVTGKYAENDSFISVTETEGTTTFLWFLNDVKIASVDADGNISEFADVVIEPFEETLDTWDSNITYNEATDTISWDNYPITGLTGSGTWGCYYLSSLLGDSNYIGYSAINYENGKLTNTAPSESDIHSQLAYLYYDSDSVPCGTFDMRVDAHQRVPSSTPGYYTNKRVAISADSTNVYYDGCQEVKTISAPTNIKDEGNYISYTVPADAKDVLAVVYSPYDTMVYSLGTYNTFYYCNRFNNTPGTYKIALASIDKNGDRSPLSDFVTVHISEVPTITSVKSTASGVALNWSSVSDATSYRVYRADTATGTKKLIKAVSTLTCTDTTATNGNTYYYFVAAYNSKTGVLGNYSNYAKITYQNTLPTPTISSITTNGSSVTLAWDKVTDATSYRVYRADSATGTKTLLKGVAATTYTDTTVTSGKTYYYFVTAYDSATGRLSAYSAAKSIKVETPLAAPAISAI